jgi:hypothetical protein
MLCLPHPVRNIPRAYTKSFDEFTRAQEAFDMLNSTTPKHQQSVWQTQLAQALANRAEDVSAMDVFNLSIQKRKARSRSTILVLKMPFSSFSL